MELTELNQQTWNLLEFLNLFPEQKTVSLCFTLAQSLAHYHQIKGPHGHVEPGCFTLSTVDPEQHIYLAKLSSSHTKPELLVATFEQDISRLGNLFLDYQFSLPDQILTYMLQATTGQGYRSVVSLLHDFQLYQKFDRLEPGVWNPYSSIAQLPFFWSEELQEISQMYQDGSTNLVLLAGLGSGKTTILRTFYNNLCEQTSATRKTVVIFYCFQAQSSQTAGFWDPEQLSQWFPEPPHLPAELTSQNQITGLLVEIQHYLLEGSNQESDLLFILDDLQWIDRVGLLILQTMLQSSTIGCRILAGSREQLKDLDLQSFYLQAISPQRLWLYLSKGFEGMDRDDLQRLFVLLEHQIQGSIFQLIASLRLLESQGSLTFQHLSGIWHFSSLNQGLVGDTTQGYLQEFLNHQTSQSIQILLVLALFNRAIEQSELKLITGLPEQILHLELVHWTQQLWIKSIPLMLSQEAQFPKTMVEQSTEYNQKVYDFSHDNYRQAVLGFVDSHSKTLLGQRIIVHIMNKIDWISDSSLLLYLLGLPTLVEWFIQIYKDQGLHQVEYALSQTLEKGLHSQGFEYAKMFFQQYTPFLWNRYPQTSYALLRLTQKLGLLAAEYQEAMELGKRWLPYVDHKEALVPIMSTNISGYFAQHRLPDCVREFESVFELLGMSKKPRFIYPSRAHIVRLKKQWKRWLTHNQTYQDTPTRLKLYQELLCKHYQEYYLGSTETIPEYILDIFDQTLFWKPNEFTPTIFILTAMIALGWLQDPQWGLELGNVGLSFTGLSLGIYTYSALRVIHGLMIDHWQTAWHETSIQLKELFFQSRELGDYSSAGLALNISASNRVFSQGGNLKEAYEEFLSLEPDLKVLRQTRSYVAYRRHLQILYQLTQPEPGVLLEVPKGPHFDWKLEVPYIQQQSDYTALFDLHLNRMAVALLAGEISLALAMQPLVESFAERYRSQTKEGLFHYLSCYLTILTERRFPKSSEYWKSLSLRAQYNPKEYQLRFLSLQKLKKGPKGLIALEPILETCMSSNRFFDCILLSNAICITIRGKSKPNKDSAQYLAKVKRIAVQAAETWGAQSLVTILNQQDTSESQVFTDISLAQTRINHRDQSGLTIEPDEQSLTGIDSSSQSDQMIHNQGFKKDIQKDLQTLSHDPRANLHNLAALGTIATALMHEIRNPNHIIQLNAEILATKAKHREDQLALDSAQDILDASTRIAGLVDQIKNFARPRGEGFSGNLINISNQVIQSLIHEYELTSDMIISEMSGTGLFIGDESRVTQVIMNLLENALQAIPVLGGWVTLRVYQDIQYSICEISDNGKGIAAEHLEQVTKPFFTTRIEQGGTGLGLFIVDTIIKELQGVFEISSTQGIGTVVRVKLPKFVDTLGGKTLEP
jgi:signal transduction histidine kinase